MGEVPYEVRREANWGALVLHDPSLAICRAPLPGYLRRRSIFEFEGIPYSLSASRSGIPRMQVLRGDETVGSIEPTADATFARVELPDAWPVPVQIFVLAVLASLWRKGSRNRDGGR